MTNLKRASNQLFSRPEDERFPDFDVALRSLCKYQDRFAGSLEITDRGDSGVIGKADSD